MKYLITYLILIVCFPAQSQRTVGLLDYQYENREGYVLFSPMPSKKTYLIDKCGEKVHEWNASTYNPALSSYLLEDGSLIRAGRLNNPSFGEGGSGGVLERFDWQGNLTWSYTLSNATNCMHHDFKVMPNGHILCIVWDSYTKTEAIAQGKDVNYNQTTLWSEKIVELEPIGTNSANIVWEWKLWDHLVQEYDASKPNFGVVADHPELVNLNYFPGAQNTADWIHLNSIDYHPDLDQIVISSHRMCEIWIIDHSTTTAEAASHSGGNAGKGGDLLYRWGNPQAYNRGGQSNKIFFGQHHATWVPAGYPNAGRIMVFNNGLGRLGDYSSIDRIITPLNANGTYGMSANGTFLPTGLDWSYISNTPSSFYSSNISGVYPLENGSFLISSGANGRFFEINSTQKTLWTYVNPVVASGVVAQGDSALNNPVFRANFYEPNYPAFVGKNLQPQGPIEANPLAPSICESLGTDEVEMDDSWQIYPNPTSDRIVSNGASSEEVEVLIWSPNGELIRKQSGSGNLEISLTALSNGWYWIEIQSNSETLHREKIIKF